MQELLVVSYWRGNKWEGFDTYFVNHRGNLAGACLNNRPFFKEWNK
jgi:hypothetical protein